MKKKPQARSRRNLSTTDFSTTLSKEAKTALTRFCEKRGLRMNRFLEEIIWDRLEEEMDAEIAADTDFSDLVDLKDVARNLE